MLTMLNGITSRFGMLLAFLIYMFVSTTAQAAIPASERTVLDAIYASTNGTEWIQKTGWGGAPGTECSWYGIICDADGSNIIELDLGPIPFFGAPISNNLSGSLPSISGLTALKSFNIYLSHVTGLIPPT